MEHLLKPAILIAVVLVTAAGDMTLKLASSREYPFRSYEIYAGIAMYAMPAVGWMHLMRSNSLAQIGVMYSCATIIILAIIGRLCFGEQISTKQMAGLVAAIFSIWLSK